MCGVAGQYNFDASATVSPDALRRVIDRLRHRGPESIGVWTDGNVGLSHARLKVVDPEHGEQPMHGAGGSVLSYVGELYNNSELRAELAVRGYPFTTTSDTEVLLAAFETWGEAAWARLNGMFALALCQPQSRQVLLLRDRHGIKPLFYRSSGNQVDFSSEPAAWTDAAKSRSGILRFLRFNHLTAGGDSFIRDVHSLPPGHLLRIDGNEAACERWHEPEPVQELSDEDPAALRAKLRHLLHLSVSRQMAADSDIGVMLSGGLDSAIITGLLSQMRPEPVRTFAISLEGDDTDLLAARDVAKRFGTEHTELTVSIREFLQAVHELTEIRRLPVSLPNEVLIYLLSKRAGKDVKVLLSGEGADELFGGYSFIFDRMRRYRQAVARAREGDSILLELLKKELPHCSFESEARFFESCSTWLTAAQLRELLHPSWLPDIESFEAWDHAAPALCEACELQPHAPIERLMQSYHLPQLLNRLDGATMAASIEGRVPFMDNDVVDYARALPASLKFAGNGNSKKILRDTFADVLGPSISRRRKRAFHASPELLFTCPIGKKSLDSTVASGQHSEFLNTDRALRLFSSNRGQQDYLGLWLLYSLCVWENSNHS